MRDVNNHDDYGYTEDMMEAMHECTLLLADPEPDVLTAIIEKEDAALMARQIAALQDAMATLTEKQRKRLVMHFYEGKTFREIAEIEGTKEAPIDRSIQDAKKKIRDFLKKVS